MHSRGRKGITCAIRATLLMASVGLAQEALVLNTSPQHHVFDSQEEGNQSFVADDSQVEGNQSFVADPCAFTRKGGKELLAL